MNAQDIADRYFGAMRGQDVEKLVGLFAEDGIIKWPDGREIAGHAAMRDVYASLFQAPTNNPQPGAFMLGPGCFSTEVHSRLPDGTERRTCNVFDVRADGLVTRMSSYRQG